MKKALIAGIHYGDKLEDICIQDAKKIHELLDRNEDGSNNFDCKLLTSSETVQITDRLLLKNLEKLLTIPADSALFYFSGHGTVTNIGGYMVTEGAAKYDEGVDMDDVMKLINRSPVREICMIIDCCYGGNLGDFSMGDSGNKSLLRQGVSILTSSRSSETSAAKKSGSVFTSLVCNALKGGAADIFGTVNMAGVYSYVDRALGAWDQRPLYKANVDQLRPLRQCTPQIDLMILRNLTTYFESPDSEHKMDPAYEPTEKKGDGAKEIIMGHLQKLRDIGCVVPVGAEHLYYAAIESKSCKLTPLGQYYWQMVKQGRI